MVHRSRRRLTACILAILTTFPSVVFAAGPEVTLERIMAHPDWIGNPPEEPYWADDGHTVYYERKRQGEEPRDLLRVDLATNESTIVEDKDRGAVDARGGEISRDRRWKVYEREGDIYLKNLETGELRQITRTAAREQDPLFLVGASRISYRQDNAFFVVDLVSGLVTQAADLRLEDDPDKEKEKSWLEAQQTRLFDVIREDQEKKKREREQETAEQRADPTRPPLPWYLGKDVEIEGGAPSPAGDWLLVVTAPKRGEGTRKPTEVARFVTESGNVETEETRAKVGTEEPVPHALVLLDLRNHQRHDLDLAVLPGIKDDPLKALREAAEARKKKDEKEGKDKKDEKGEKKEASPRPVEVLDARWSDDGSRLAVQLRTRDNKDRWIATVDLTKHEIVPRHRLTDRAWINYDFNDFGWLRDNATLWYLSEESGWSNLYLVSDETGKARPLVGGRYEVSTPVLDHDGRFLYYTANQGHPGIFETWRVEVATGKAEQLTQLGGVNTTIPSPDGTRLLVVHSSVTRPNELYVQDNRPGAQARQITNTRSPEFLAIDWAVPEIVPIPSKHRAGAPIFSRVYTPKDFDPARRYPAVVFTHGAGYLQNAHQGWSSYFREFMFHTLLTRHGYVVLDMDYRASAGYGRDWRTAIYRQMGHPEVEDLEDGVAWLVANKGVDPQRVGTYGGSYGGFLTFMSLFREPDLFAAGAALRPVTDWAHYNQAYTSNILNTPEVDPEAYQKSSPIEYAKGLSKPLLICTGMLDDNVFFQDTVRLVQRLIELEKKDFETAIYPVERHAFVRPSSWLDEYRRIFELFETHLK
ncbi:MAG TPA: prolyl oligopeptidase family serine peptidase [Thermoanaerobaculia bacterium]|nr:prolyl oligopeptidase family serine peptidase [Thermoanaerobaculia bacterium]